jgi:cytochrome P450
MGWWTRPVAYMERCRARYGKRFTIRLLGSPPFVMLSDPDDIQQVFKMAPDVLHPGEGARVLEPIVGPNSVILLDEGAHLEQRKLMLPAFHGKKMAELESLMTEVTEREVASWPRDAAIPLHPRMQKLTLEIILRAVFGLDEGERLDALRDKLTTISALGSRPAGLIPQLQGHFDRFTGWREFLELGAEADALIYELIAERRADAGAADRPDVMAMFLAARHEDGSPMSDAELRDELMTMLIAGHETTASELAWVFERLTREPRVLSRLTEEIDSGDGDEYLTATINETLRRRPVLPNAEPRLTKQDVDVGGWVYPEGVALICHAYLVHHDPAIYPDPYAFRPERFLEEPPGTYSFLPWGGGRRRCIGASFATQEMKVVLRAVLSRAEVRASTNGHELTRRRSITVSPRLGSPTVLRDRVREPVPA